MSKSISFIHTADLHLGKCFQELGAQGRHLRQCILDALSRAVDTALDRSVDLFLVAGDIFDSPDPPKDALLALDSAFSRLADAGIRVCIIPGTHDPPGSRIFDGPIFTSRPRHVFVLDPNNPARAFDDLDLCVSAWFPSRDRAREWVGPPDGWHRDKTFRIAMAHGSVLSGLSSDGPDDLIPDKILDDRDVHYLGLGHHHGMGPVSRSAMPAYYPGSLEMLAVDQKEAGHVLHVSLNEQDGQVEAAVDGVRVGTLRYKLLSMEAAEVLAGRDPEKELNDAADPDLFMDLVVEGMAPLDAALPDWDEMVERLLPGFFKLRIIDNTRRTKTLESISDIPESSVTAEFVRRMQEMIEDSEGPERAEWEEALRLGILHLTGSDQKP